MQEPLDLARVRSESKRMSVLRSVIAEKPRKER